MELQNTNNKNQLATKEQFSFSVIKLFTKEKELKESNKFAVLNREVKTSLLPHGHPNFIASTSGTKISELIESFDLASVHGAIFKMLKKYTSFFTLSKVMSAEQLDETAWIILDGRFGGPEKTIEDLYLFFELAKANRYEKPFDHIDGSIILSQLEEFMAERNRTFEKHQAEKKRTENFKNIPLELVPNDIRIGEIFKLHNSKTNKIARLRLQRVLKSEGLAIVDALSEHTPDFDKQFSKLTKEMRANEKSKNIIEQKKQMTEEDFARAKELAEIALRVNEQPEKK